ncbi:hypothetical protein UFOVP410_176 [uncultured Caudovirales phage]|uniref:Baseplate wedge subunit n=1 Tax=uncultured Caudovirales phage TaxID=2100421 RepID=A0A6J5M718_9CAUD|nr:hypothetical protein UFOVP410_176 [uncultured Caudovirales phage]
MTEIKTISPYIDSQFPEFVREDHPKLVEFIKTYYEWMESYNNPLYVTNNLKNNSDVDYAEDEYLKHLFKEFLVNFPLNLSVNKSTLLKNIKQFYRARGTEKSYELFFRAIYGLNPEFYYPRVDVLRVSDGKWIEEKSIRVFAISGSPFELKSNKIVGLKSGCTAFVEKVISIQEESYFGYELFLNRSSITGKFLPEEVVKLESSSSQVTCRISAAASDIKINNSGSGYSLGDKFLVNQTGRGLQLQVDKISTTGQIEKLSIINYGLGYDSSLPILNYSLAGSSSVSANIDIQFSSLISYPGYFSNEDGQLSTLKYIQDGYFYQQFSYVVFVNEALSVYEALLKKILHPAGFKLFGGVRAQNNIDAKCKLNLNSAITSRVITPNVVSAKVNVNSNTSFRSDVILGTIVNRSFNIKSNPLGPTNYSIYRDRFNYKPSSNIWKMSNSSQYSSYSELETGANTNYFGVSGDLSQQYAITPISVFEQNGLTPFIIETKLNHRVNILPDSVIITSI